MGGEKTYLTDSIEEIKQRLTSVEETVKRIEKLERDEIEYISTVKNMESEELRDLEDIAIMENHELSKMNKMTPVKYPDIILWKNAVWENCEHKVLIDSQTIVAFKCNISKKVCCFTGCPLNKIESRE
jgi:hypothetical protein